MRKVIGARAADKCRRKFLRHFPDGFRDETYVAWERGYKWEAHRHWRDQLGRGQFERLLAEQAYGEVAHRALRIESRTNLLYSFEKMAVRDAVRTSMGAMVFARGLYLWLHGPGSGPARFRTWVDALASMPRRRRRVVSWPVVTVFGFIAQPGRHMFLKPLVTQRAAAAYDVHFPYASRPSWPTYDALLQFGRRVCREQRDLGCRDLIDAQSFIWVQGSDEY